MVIFPKAKINIGLRITEKRSDGFHNIETIFYPVSLCDAIEFVVAGEDSTDDILSVTGIIPEGNPANNLVMKAVKKVRECMNIPFLNIHLHKAIPAGAGLGGGSSDAATMLKSLNRYFNLGIGAEKIFEMALDLGSDCPFFLDGLPAFGEGRGELLSPVKQLPEGLHILIINPGIHINTGEAFSNCNPKLPVSDLRDLYNRDISEWKDLVINDFEEFIFRKHPGIAEIKRLLYETGALYSSMSGSGSSVYGIFGINPAIPESLREMVIYSGLL